MQILNPLPVGLLELDEKGTVINFRPSKEDTTLTQVNIIGYNLFTEIEPFAEAKEFQDRIKSFTANLTPADSFHFTFKFNHRHLPVKVLLARIKRRSVLIHIRELADKVAA
jgi:photoactive yellow protein